jgi:putative neutral zinc metallopeptidase
VLAAALLAACTTRTGGTPSGPPARASGTDRPALACGAPTVAATVACLQQSLTAFWSAELGRRVPLRVISAPQPPEVPSSCRSALRLNTAFTCPSGGAVYLTGAYLAALQTKPSPAGAWYRFAATLAHEMGHVVQLAVNDVAIGKQHPTPAESRGIEQQADCLSGVWAAGVRIGDQPFLTADAQVFAIIDTAFERRTHGAPAVRLAAVRRGLAGRTPQACRLTVR